MSFAHLKVTLASYLLLIFKNKKQKKTLFLAKSGTDALHLQYKFLN